MELITNTQDGLVYRHARNLPVYQIAVLSVLSTLALGCSLGLALTGSHSLGLLMTLAGLPMLGFSLYLLNTREECTVTFDRTAGVVVIEQVCGDQCEHRTVPFQGISEVQVVQATEDSVPYFGVGLRLCTGETILISGQQPVPLFDGSPLVRAQALAAQINQTIRT